MKTNLNQKKGNTGNLLGYILLIVSIIIYYVGIQLFVVNIPFGDEFHTALQWLNSFESTDSLKQKFFLLFRQHNEHRIFTYYLAVLTDFSIFEVLNFKRLLWIGNLGMFALLIFSYQISKVERNNPWYMLPVVLLLFVPQHEISDWGIVAYGSIIQYSIVFASLLCLNKSGRYYFAAAVFLAFIATFSLGSGMFVFLSGFVILGLKDQKEKKYWIFWASAMLMGIFLYFISYNFSGDGFRFEFLRQPINTALFFFTFFGTIFNPLLRNHLGMITLMGFLSLMLLLFLVVFKWKQFKKHPVAAGMIFFIILSAAAAAVSRISFGVTGATAPRYVLLQAIFLAMLYIITIDVFKSRKKYVLPSILIVSFLLFGGRLVQNYFALQRHQRHVQNIIIDYHLDFTKIQTFWPPPPEIKKILDKSQEIGVYFPPSVSELFPEILKLEITIPVNSPQVVKYNLDEIIDHENIIKANGWAFPERNNNKTQKVVFILKSEKDTYVFSTLNRKRPDVVEHFSNSYTNLQENLGFEVVIDKKHSGIDKGKYFIGIGILQNHELVGFKFSINSVTIN